MLRSILELNIAACGCMLSSLFEVSMSIKCRFIIIIIIIIIINRHFKDAQLTKVVTKAPVVTTIQDDLYSASHYKMTYNVAVDFVDEAAVSQCC